MRVLSTGWSAAPASSEGPLTMWPWSHVAVGYLLYSVGTRLVGRRPNGSPVIVLLVATQLPDLVDKPLSWVVGVFPQGYAVAHSVFVAVPLAIAVFVITARRQRRDWGIAFLIGYGSHLVGDILFGLLKSNPYAVERVLWPLVTLPPYDADQGVLTRFYEYFSDLISMQASGDALVVVLGVGMAYVTLGVWIVDGTPGVATLRRLVASQLPLDFTSHRRD
jgi:hypothetical protein